MQNEQLTTDGEKAVASAAVPAGQMQNCARLNSVEKEASALHKNIADKNGGYYFAHSRTYEIPAHAKIITGPGLVAGGPPQRLSENGTVAEAQPQAVSLAAMDVDPPPATEVVKEAIALKEYSWSDDGEKVSVYVTCDGLPAGATASLVTPTFTAKSFKLEIATEPARKFKLDKLSKEIKPEECKVRVNAAKSKITVTLKKKRDGTWYDLVSSS